MEGDNIDGDPLQDQIDDEVDAPMDGAALLKSAMKQKLRSPSPSEDIDGKYNIMFVEFNG